MGVSKSDYLMFGVRIDGEGFSPYDDESLLPEIEGRPGRRFDIIYDGMSGEYAVLGKIIARGEDYEGFGFMDLGEKILAISTPEMEKMVDDIRHALGIHVPDEDFKLYLFTHFS